MSRTNILRTALAALFAVGGAGSHALPASAQTSTALVADPVPVIEATINQQPVRLEVDPRLPGIVLLNQEAAHRLRVQNVPIVRASLDVDDDSYLRVRVARPRIILSDRSILRALTAIMPTLAANGADGRIGPTALPYDRVTIRLRDDAEISHDLVYPWPDTDRWRVTTDALSPSLGLAFNLDGDVSVFNRAAARRYDASGAILPTGSPREVEVLAGLRTNMQPVSVQFALPGFDLSSVVAMTRAPLLGALETDAIVVRAETGSDAVPQLTLGRGALARCSSIVADRLAHRITVRCAREAAQ